jgi:microcin C transport system ATP-binding protein
MNEILKVNNLELSIGSNKLIDNISFKINKSEIFALVGQSGSGKSLTAYSILNLLSFFGNFHVNGEVIFENKNNLKLPESEMQKIRGGKIGMIFQDPMTSLNPLHKIGRQLSEAVELHQKLSKIEIELKILELLEMVELDNLKNRLADYPHQLSGGQRQRLMIAMALANNPSLIIADEPTTALDVTVQKEILGLLKKLQIEKGLSILLITHDLTIVKRIADRVAVMKSGKILEEKPTKVIFSYPESDYAKKLLSSEPKKLEKNTLESPRKLLEVKDLNVSYQIGKSFLGFEKKYFNAVKNINFKLNQTQTIGVVGESGSGKSTVAKAILKLVKSSGVIVLNGENVQSYTEKKFKKFRKNIQIVFQDPYSSLNPRLTIKQIIEEGLDVHFYYSQQEKNKIIDEILMEMGLNSNYKNRFPHELSGGEKQRIGLARSLVLKPDILVLDEPTSALDLITQAEILKIIESYQNNNNIGIIFISHDLRVIKAVSDNIIVMKNGEMVNYGDTNYIFNSQEPYTKNLIDSAFVF